MHVLKIQRQWAEVKLVDNVPLSSDVDDSQEDMID